MTAIFEDDPSPRRAALIQQSRNHLHDLRAKRWVEPKAKEAESMPNDPKYDAAVSLAKEHLTQAFEAFRADPRIPWPELHGTVAKAQAQVWVEALKNALEHHRQIEGLLS